MLLVITNVSLMLYEDDDDDELMMNVLYRSISPKTARTQ